MSNIIQLLPVQHPLTIEFPRVSMQEFGYKPIIVPVEFIALVDYDGQREVEYAAIVDGKMMLFNVDGVEVSIRRTKFEFRATDTQNDSFADEFKNAMKRMKRYQ